VGVHKVEATTADEPAQRADPGEVMPPRRLGPPGESGSLAPTGRLAPATGIWSPIRLPSVDLL